MKRVWLRAAAIALLAVMLLTLTACDRTHVDKEVKEICKQLFVYVDEYLEGERDIMTTYTAVLAVYTYWDGLDIETTKYTVTRNFQAKMMAKNILESLSRQASGEDARAAILRQRNALADIAGLPQLKTK
ncbi:MAG: hypothetical protein J5849_01875 [Clostridia bacterium]|nr:hypothetical protein [Clostridia bacterium]MBR5743401.1 hypothetical protein [Clostridia bacterium]